MNRIWVQTRHYWARHRAHPVIFATLYAARPPFLLAALTRRARQHWPSLSAAAVFLVLAVLPYTCVLIFGRGLPGWSAALVVAFAAIAVTRGPRELHVILRHNASPGPERAGGLEVPCSGR